MLTSNLFKIGHRIDIDIINSRFPASVPNPNTESALGTETKTIRAQQIFIMIEITPPT